MADLLLKNIYKVYEGGVRAVSDFNLEIADKEFVVFVGPSGCGKSTTLRMIAGLEEITAGDLYIDGVRVNDVEPKDRNIAMVFQNYALYPHMTVFQNMAFGLKLRKLPPEEIAERVNRAAEILGISELLNRKPKALSGGQRQRVALGRAIVREPNVFLLDEPLSNLDAKLRVQMRTEITKLHKRLQTTFIYVTHDQTEAMTMGDRIVVMKDGFVQQVDTPAVLYDEPANVFVATFLGSPQMNIIEGVLCEKNGLYVDFSSIRLDLTPEKARQLTDKKAIGKPVLLGIRPENMTLAESGIPATVDVVEHLGSETFVYLNVEGIQGNIVLTVPTDYSITSGQKTFISVDINKIHLFDKATSNSIMGVPVYSEFDCEISNKNVRLSTYSFTLPEYFDNRMFSFSENKCKIFSVTTSKIRLTETPESIRLDNCRVEFSVRLSDSYSLYLKTPLGDNYLVIRTKEYHADGEELSVYIPYSAMSFTDENGMRLNSREKVSPNTANCKVTTENGVTKIAVAGTTFTFEDMGIQSGDYVMRLKEDGVTFAYDKAYAKKNKLDSSVPSNSVRVSAYDEDKLGAGKNAVFVKINGFDDYVTAIIEDSFSVYKMPEFYLTLKKDGFTLE